ncbi:hypothetical protein [Bradyrhizobium sp. NBAIM01]|uniref:hypothetical protein n=1 Tax=Bradyrhizobium sp. NBAIM01 TaxID=2793818 RepID=UPI001CD505AD|nr:hypothetical protein [Bradyrhizobium sp. NBAIM01]
MDDREDTLLADGAGCRDRMDALEAQAEHRASRRRMVRLRRDDGRIKEIRAYYAAPADASARICQLVDFDYRGRGYHLACE